jgi:hypothetical protein
MAVGVLRADAAPVTAQQVSDACLAEIDETTGFVRLLGAKDLDRLYGRLRALAS